MNSVVPRALEKSCFWSLDSQFGSGLTAEDKYKWYRVICGEHGRDDRCSQYKLSWLRIKIHVFTRVISQVKFMEPQCDLEVCKCHVWYSSSLVSCIRALRLYFAGWEVCIFIKFSHKYHLLATICYFSDLVLIFEGIE